MRLQIREHFYVAHQLFLFSLLALQQGKLHLFAFRDVVSFRDQVDHRAVVVETDTARRPPSIAAASSVLDASGYVVARRQATVSSKMTGKVLEVLVEEGMRVEEGQVVARLDAATQRAQLAVAQAQAEADIINAGLAVGVVSTASSTTVPAGNVISPPRQTSKNSFMLLDVSPLSTTSSFSPR